MPRSVAGGRTAATNRVAVQDIKSSLSFNGTSSYMTSPVVPDVTGFNFGMWLNIKKPTGSGKTLVCWANNVTPTQGFKLVIQNDNSGFYAAISNSAGGTQYCDAPNSTNYRHKWVHVVFTHIQGAQKIYVNGVLYDTTNATMLGAAGQTLTFGRNSFALTEYSNDLMSSIVFQNTTTPWTQQQITDLYTSGKIPSGATAIYKLDEGADTTAYDTSGNGNNGTITAGTYTADVPTKKRALVGGNLVKNGDFEYAPPFVAATTTTARWIDGTAMGSTTNSLFGWGFRIVSGSCAAQFDSINKRSENYSLKLSTTATGSRVFVYYNSINGNIDKTLYNIPSKPNTSYTLSYWMKTSLISGSSTGARIGVQKKNVAGITGEEFTNSIGIATTTDWTYYSFTFTTNVALDTPYLFVVPQIVGQDGAGTLIMDAWFDDITLTPTVNTTRTAV